MSYLKSDAVYESEEWERIRHDTIAKYACGRISLMCGYTAGERYPENRRQVRIHCDHVKPWNIIPKYRNDPPKHDFIFPELKVLDKLDHYKVQRKLSHAGKRLEKKLNAIANANGINKKLSMHISRHSFAQIAGDKISIKNYRDFIGILI
jgi:hypothetical protein